MGRSDGKDSISPEPRFTNLGPTTVQSLIVDKKTFASDEMEGAQLMPRGTRHELIGTLRYGLRGFELHVDDGGVWLLDVRRCVRKLLDQRVRVEGIRAGFNLLDVDGIYAA